MISVITVTYNNYDDLHNTLHSLKKVDGIESIVVNGGDCDKTKTLLKNFNGIEISEPDKGISDAFNKRYYWFYTEKWADSLMGIRDSRDRLTPSGRPRRQVNWWKGKMERK